VLVVVADHAAAPETKRPITAPTPSQRKRLITVAPFVSCVAGD
jgi:hypothetical protein